VLDTPANEDVMRLLELDSITREVLRKRTQREEDVHSKESEAKTALDKLQRKGQEVFVKQEAVRTLKSEIERVEADIKAHDSLMLSDGYDWDGRQRALDTDVEQAQTDKVGGGSIGDIFKKVVQKIETEHDPKCIVCSQSLPESARATIKRKYDQFLNHQRQGNDLEHRLQTARDAASKHRRSHEQWQSYRKQKASELPATEQTLDKLKGEQATLKRQHEQARASRQPPTRIRASSSSRDAAGCGERVRLRPRPRSGGQCAGRPLSVVAFARRRRSLVVGRLFVLLVPAAGERGDGPQGPRGEEQGPDARRRPSQVHLQGAAGRAGRDGAHAVGHAERDAHGDSAARHCAR
jgi:predicted  nucleic acid-binding Zn-ribbon protein